MCSHSGSTNGLGTLDTTGTMTEHRKKGTNYMRIVGTMQRRVGGKWVKVFTYAPYRSSTFPNDATSHTFTQTFRDRKLATKVRTSAPCTA